MLERAHSDSAPGSLSGAPTERRERFASLLDLDPELGREVPAPRRVAARTATTVRVRRVAHGLWPAPQLTPESRGLGLLVIDGLVAREVLADNVATMELLGPGDLLRPGEEFADVPLLAAAVRWNVLADARVAILDGAVAMRLAGQPEIYCALIERLAWRVRRLAVMQAISQLYRVDRRLLTLLWHLADRWGRVTPAGVVVPLALSHRMLGQLVGARRPSVSTALGELGRAGEVTRLADGTWLLPGGPVGAPDERASRFVPPRRQVVAAALRPPR